MDARTNYIEALKVIKSAKQAGIIAASFTNVTKAGRSVKVCYKWNAPEPAIATVHQQLAALTSSTPTNAARGWIFRFSF